MIYIIIGFVLILIIFMLFVFLFIKNNNIKRISHKIDMASEEIKKELDKNLDITTRLINIIQKNEKKENKLFKKVKNIKSEKLNEYEIDSLLTETANILLDMKDSCLNSKVKSFDGLIKDLEISNMNLVSIRTYYNKYVGIFNNLVTKRSTMFLSKIKGYKTKKFFEGKELEEEAII